MPPGQRIVPSPRKPLCFETPPHRLEPGRPSSASRSVSPRKSRISGELQLAGLWAARGVSGFYVWNQPDTASCVANCSSIKVPEKDDPPANDQLSQPAPLAHTTFVNVSVGCFRLRRCKKPTLTCCGTDCATSSLRPVERSLSLLAQGRCTPGGGFGGIQAETRSSGVR